jgi:hypothetical protein
VLFKKNKIIVYLIGDLDTISLQKFQKEVHISMFIQTAERGNTFGLKNKQFKIIRANLGLVVDIPFLIG